MNELALPTPRSFEQWCAGLGKIVAVRKNLRWFLADWLLLGEDRFGEKIWQAISDTGYTEGDIRNMMSVARKFPPDERCALPWSWHAALAPLPKRERDKAITQALSGNLTRADLRALTNGANGNGASSAENPPDSITVLETALATAYVTVGKLVERKERGKLTDDALDALIDAAMALKQKLAH